MSGYYLNPTISGNLIAFTSEDDLWITDLRDKTARPVVENFGTVSHPQLSPDGKRIAFRVTKGNSDTISEIYVSNVDGSDLRRATWMGSPITDLTGWNGNDKLIIISDEKSPFMRETLAFEVDLNDFGFKMIRVGPCSGIFNSKNDTFVLRGLKDLTFWKGYRGGTRGILWCDHGNKGKFTKFLELETGIYSPTYVDGRIYFITDLDGRGNVYSVDLKGKDMKQHTHFKEYYARNLSSDGKTLVFQMAGGIYSLEPLSDDPKKLDLKVPLKGVKSQKRFIEPGKFIEDFEISPQSIQSAFTVRGNGFLLEPKTGKTESIGHGSEVRLRELKISVDGKRFFLLDSGESEKLLLLDGGKEKLIYESDCFIEAIFPSPDGLKVAFTTNRYELYMVNAVDGNVRKLIENEFGRLLDVSWHPSTKWLAVSIPESAESKAIFIVDINSGERIRVTTFGFNDFAPKFGPAGHFLYYLSDRNLDPVYDKITFDLGFPRVTLPFMVTLHAEEKPPFKRTGGADNSCKEKNDHIDLEGINGRSTQIPLQPADYDSIWPSKNALFLVKFPTEGALKFPFFASSPRDDGSVTKFDLESGKEKTVLDKISDAKLSEDGVHMLVRRGKEFSVDDMTKRTGAPREMEDSEASVRIDLGRVKCQIDPKKEWRQMLLETWRLMKENYWREKKISPKWVSIKERYLPLMERAGTRFEASDVLKEMQGESGTSHSYEMGGDTFIGSFHSIGKLGADLEKKDNTFVISSCLEPDVSMEAERSPLIGPGLDIRVGDIVTAINNTPLDNVVNFYPMLENLAGEHIDLTVQRGRASKTYDVSTLKSETGLRYRAWVEQNRKYVHEKSKGKVGYLHIPDMGPRGFAEFFRLYRSEWDHDALIVDVRSNGGGHVSHLLLEKVARQLIGYDIPRRGNVEHYPRYAIRGGIVALTNEFAGSDGDIFSHSFKLLKIGALIGTRTWGGVVGINPTRKLVDGTFVTQPEFSFWFKDVGFGVENYGTDPTIVVEISPDEYGRNEDPQLDRGIKEALMTLPKNAKPFLDDYKNS